MSIGFTPHGTISKKRKIYWEAQLFALIRSFSDGITFFRFNCNWDRYKDEHSPAFQIELTIFNLYFHFWVYQNSESRIEPIDINLYNSLCNKVKRWGVSVDEFDMIAAKYINENTKKIEDCYYAAYIELKGFYE